MKNNLVSKVMRSLKNDGPLETLIQIGRVPFLPYVLRIKEKTVFRQQSIEDRFTSIYELNYWGSRESRSGVGSKLHNTENLRRVLPGLFKDLNVTSVFDAPCGDFNWMKLVLQQHPIDYTGGDIVEPLIAKLTRDFGNETTRFVHLDITRQPFVKADLMICRDCLFHLSYDDTRRMLVNFVDSDIAYLLTTTHLAKGIVNSDIPSGHFRLIDLFSAPFNFPKDVHWRVDDVREPGKETEMCLWTHDQIANVVANFPKTVA